MKKKISPSWAALVVASVALFAALGGSAWAEGLISGSQIQSRSITSKKIGRGQIKAVNLAPGAVGSSNLAAGAVTSSSIADQAVTSNNLANAAVTSTQLADAAVTGAKVAPGSLTAADVAPNTFLAADGTAVDSNQLGGVPASGFVQGTGNMLRNWVEILAGASDQTLLDVGLGEVDGSCLAGGKPQVSFTAETQPLNLIESGTTAPNSPDINTDNGLTVGSSYVEPNTSGLPQAIEFQVAQTGVAPPHVATAWVTGQANGVAACIFTAQALTTGP
jgi:hypothetical protein